LEILKADPKGLCNELFLIEEIENLHLPAGFQKTYSQIRSERQSTEPTQKEVSSVPPAQGVQYSRGNRPLLDESPNINNLLKHNKEFEEVFNNIILRNVIEAHEGAISQHPNVYSLIGRVWFIKFMQKEWGLYPDHEKYNYLAHLLKLTEKSPEEELPEFSFNNPDLVAWVKKKDISDVWGDEPAQEYEELNDPTCVDDRSWDEIKHLKEMGYETFDNLKYAERSGDKGAAKRAQAELDKIRSFLLNEHGILTRLSADGNKMFFRVLIRPDKFHEGARQLIKNQVRNALKDFEGRMPLLNRHLNRSLEMRSHQTSYIPENQINWHVSM
jgi:hypothetical protein